MYAHLVKPLRVKIVSPNDLLMAGKEMPLTCETWGSHPPAKVTWLLDGVPILHSDISTHNDNSEVRLYSLNPVLFNRPFLCFITGSVHHLQYFNFTNFAGRQSDRKRVKSESNLGK